MTKVLFVCHGNICRSPMAEFMFKDMVERAGRAEEFFIRSAAAHSDEIGSPVYPPARRKLAEHGIGCAGHAAHRMTRAEYDEYDLIICMDRANLRDIRRLSGGDPEGKIHRLLDFSGRPRDIADPWYTGDFDTTYDDIYEGCQCLLNHLITEGKIYGRKTK